MGKYSLLTLRILFLTVICFSYGYSYIGSSQPPNTGDGLIHFFISQASWSDPLLFFHHWGKPLFTLFSSPFSQFGYGGIVLFNCIVTASTIVLGWKILDHFKVNKATSLLLPIALFAIPDIHETVLSGLTEPFFNLILVVSFFALVKERFIIFAILISFLPFCRSEGQLMLILAIPLLIVLKQFKPILFLGTGFMIYAIMGSVFLGDFFWYFNNSPYHMSNDIYGSGEWFHYLKSYPFYLGYTGLIIGLIGTGLFLYFTFKKTKLELKSSIAIFGALSFFGVIAAHSYFWATGQNGSLGLTRIATQGLPLFLIICIYFIDQLPFLNNRFVSIFVGVASLVLLFTSVPKNAEITTVKNLDASIHYTAEFLKGKEYRIHYYHPLLAYLLEQNPFGKSTNLIRNESSLSVHDQIEKFFRPGDLLVRDSHFGRQGPCLPLKALETESRLVLIDEFPSSFQFKDDENGVEGVRVYQYLPNPKDRIEVPKKIEKNNSKRIIKIKSDQLYTGIIDTFIIETSYFQSSIITELEDLKMVLDINDGESINYYDLIPGKPLNEQFAIGKKGHVKYYIWNPQKRHGEIELVYLNSNPPKKHYLGQALK